MPKIAVIGEGVIDRFIDGLTYRDVIGGSGLNTAVASARAGAETHWFTRTSPDLNGQALSAYARAEGVLSEDCVEGLEPASVVQVHLSKTGQPRYEFSLEGAVDWQWTESELSILKDRYELIHVSSLSAVIEPGASLIRKTLQFLKSQTDSPLVTYDPNSRPAAAKDSSQELEMKNHILAMVEISDVIKVSDEDLDWLEATKPADAIAKYWSTIGPKLVVLTKGASGAVAFAGGDEIASVIGEKIKVADTVGAGDTFMGWLIAQIANEYNFEIPTTKAAVTTLLQKSARAAAINCTRVGCVPPFRNELN
jgi:fructokinase